MQNQSLTELINSLEQELLRLGYANRGMRFYRKRWHMLLEFAKEQGESHYSERLGMDFLEKSFSICEEDMSHTLSRSQIQDLRIIRMIGDFQLHRTILRRYVKHKEILTAPYFIDISNRFKLYCVDKNYSKSTTDHYVNQSARFMDYLVSQNVADCKTISIALIQAYIKTLAGYSHQAMEQNICSLRSLFRFLLEAGEVQTDFAAKTPMVQARKHIRIPSVWTADELKKLITAIDRGSPKGKRDYAIILLACCLGMRCADITALKMENFFWEDKKLVFTQSKTRTDLSLPLTPEVGWAVIDYLKYGRPKIDSPYVFVRHRVPFYHFTKGTNLYELIRRYMESAHIPVTKNHKRGMHSLRHTMASMLLEKDTPLSTIADILGHIDANSTDVYLKIDLKKLRECALAFEGGINNE